MDALIDLLTGREFLVGLIAGGVIVGIAFGLRRFVPDWALLWSAAGVVAFVVLGTTRGGGGAGLSRGPGVGVLGWIGAVVAVALAAYGLWRLRNLDVAALAVAISVAGVWATVPDTEGAAVLVGVAAGATWAWWPTRWSRPGMIGAVALASLVAWVAMAGGVARDTGLIGGLASLGVIGWSAVAVPRTNRWVWLGAHALTVVVWSRWAGLMSNSFVAVTIGLVASVIIGIGAGFFDGRPAGDGAATGAG